MGLDMYLNATFEVDDETKALIHEIGHTYDIEGEHQAYLKGTAGRMLTPVTGFFFGDTAIDEWYDQDLVHTMTQIPKAISALIARRVPFTMEYRSSW